MSSWDEGRAVRYLLWLLGRRDHARAELERRLERKPVTPEVRERALRRLEELDLLDDGRVAEGFVRGRRHRKGRLALRREMARLGLPEEATEAALAPLSDDDQLEAAREVLIKHAWRFASGDRRKDRAKAAGFLARRGFPADPAREAVDEFFAARPGDDPSDDGPDDEDPDEDGLEPDVSDDEGRPAARRRRPCS